MSNLSAAMIAAALVGAAAGAVGQPLQYMPPGTAESGGIEDMVLIYHGSKVRMQWTSEALMPYVAYVDEQGRPQDWFFDSFLFIEFTLDDGTYFHHKMPDQRLPTIQDWQGIADSWFRPGVGLDGLERAVGEVGRKLGDPDHKVKVVITMPVPFTADRSFGPLPGKSDTLDLSRTLDRQRALRWYIQEVLRQWRQRDYQHLELTGFYWTDESIGGTEKELVRWTSDYLHARGLKHYWIPYYGAGGLNAWREAGFDAVMMQPNYYWPEKRPSLTHMLTASKMARMAGTGIELEFDGRALTDEEFRDRMTVYLDAGVFYGWMDHALMGYYEGGTAVGTFSKSPEVGRRLYRDVYDYVKGTYQSSGRFDFAAYPLAARNQGDNLALASRGGQVLGAETRPEWGDEIGPEQINDGNVDFYGGMSGFGAFYIPGSFTIKLSQVAEVARTEVFFYDLDQREFRYTIETSVDGQRWAMAVDKSAGDWIGHQVDQFEPRQARYVRFTCLHNSVNAICQVVEFEVYGK